MKNFWVRTASATVYAILFLGSIYSARLTGNQLLGEIILTAFLLFVTCGCTFEFFRIVSMQGASPCKPLGYLLAALTVVTISMKYDTPIIPFLFFSIIPVIFAIAATVQLWRQSDQPFRDAAYSILPMLYIALPLGLMPSLQFDEHVLIELIVLVWINDSAAYMGGSLCGGKKLWPRHSPGKTISGTLIGIIVTVAVAMLLGPLCNDNIPRLEWMGFGLICSIVATLGDLVESMLKRSVGLKDSGKIMPGHGGFLDRFDSLLFVIPTAFLFIFLI